MPVALVLLTVLSVAIGTWQLVSATGTGGDEAVARSPRPSIAASSLPSAASSPSASDVDRSVAVLVSNGTGRSGLATETARRLRERGWLAAVGSDQPARTRTTVFYPLANQQATAQATADELGGEPALKRSGRYGSDAITIVLGADVDG